MSSSPKASFTEKFTSATSIYYGWVIVFVATLLMGIGYGIMYSYSVFFKPILDHLTGTGQLSHPYILFHLS